MMFNNCMMKFPFMLLCGAHFCLMEFFFLQLVNRTPPDYFYQDVAAAFCLSLSFNTAVKYGFTVKKSASEFIIFGNFL